MSSASVLPRLRRRTTARRRTRSKRILLLSMWLYADYDLCACTVACPIVCPSRLELLYRYVLFMLSTSSLLPLRLFFGRRYRPAGSCLNIHCRLLPYRGAITGSCIHKTAEMYRKVSCSPVKVDHLPLTPNAQPAALKPVPTDLPFTRFIRHMYRLTDSRGTSFDSYRPRSFVVQCHYGKIGCHELESSHGTLNALLSVQLLQNELTRASKPARIAGI